MAAEAVLTVVTVQGRFEDRRIADRPSCDASADFLNNACRLVSDNHRIIAKRIADAAIGEVVEVGATNADGRYTHLDFAGTGVRGRGCFNETK
jgi:hypothetical protein